MIERRLLVHALFLTLLPVLVAWFDLSTPAAILLVLLLLLWRWLVVLSGWVIPAKTPELVLCTISVSHFVEKVRWSMDRLGVDYVEQPSGGTLGAFFLGRTVPQLKARTGAVQSVIGNSPEILRYLWGRYGVERPESAAFLQPTPERVELESRIDRYGVNLQVWVYYHLLNDRELTLHAWGANNAATPYWQRLALRGLRPVLVFLIRKSFKITAANYAKAVAHIERFLNDVEDMLQDERKSLLGGDETDFADIAFAAISGPWLMPPQYGAGRADAVRFDDDRAPADYRRDVAKWMNAYPRAVAFIQRLYAEERTA